MPARGQRKKHTSLRPISEERIVLGRVIAERTYRIGRRTILLQIGAPHEASWGRDFYCPFCITGPGLEPKVRRVFGADAVQALMLVFDAIKALLQSLSPTITFDGSQRPGDVGIYRRLTTSLGANLDRKIDRFADKVILARAQELKRRYDRKQARSSQTHRGRPSP